MKASRTTLPWLGALLSGLLLSFSFPPLGWGDWAWVCLVPLILGLRVAEGQNGVRLSFAAGLVFWLLNVHFVTHVSYWGWIGLALYCSIYFIPVGMFISWWFRRVGVRHGLGNVAAMSLAAATWSASEYLRSILFTGFAWNGLGVSQASNLTIVQIAAWGGVPAVSFVILLVNMAIALTILRYIEMRGRWGKRWHPELMIALLIWATVHTIGWKALSRKEPADHSVRIALIQPNIPQVYKWTAEHIDLIYSRLSMWTHAAAEIEGVDLIVWPETALPDDVRNSPRSSDFVQEIMTHGVPLLVGSMDTTWSPDEGLKYFNSSFLFDEHGALETVYDKQHLVLFGEYVPLDKTFPFLGRLTPISESFTAGQTGTVFTLKKKQTRFSVLICFEDSVSKLARQAAKNGARLLVNQSNDAWFDVSSASRQHMQQCLFRCIETGLPAVRATNTGVTCAIDRRGRVLDRLDDGQGRTLVEGFRVITVDIPPENMEHTFYVKVGDLFAQLCLVVSLLTFLGVFRVEKGILKRDDSNAQSAGALKQSKKHV